MPDRQNVTRLPFPLDIPSLHALKDGGFILSGTATLAAGVAAISDKRIHASSVAVVAYVTPAGTMGANLKGVCTAGTLTITAVKSDKTTETSDTSLVAYLIIL
jgi:hypothetical protein